MTEPSFLTWLSLGFMLGLRHALDSDHVAAVSTVLAERPTLKASGLVGFSWGIGHTVILLVVGLIVLWLRVPVPDSLAQAAEGLVGIMLVVLGSMLGMKLWKERWHVHQHDHDGTRHVHLHSHAVVVNHGHFHWWRESVRPLCIGMAHGLAGSAALLLLVVSSARTVSDGLIYIGLFGFGSIVGMMLIGLVLSLPIVWSLRFGRPVFLVVQGLASLGSVGLGLSIVYRILVSDQVS
ncbi:HoxN/HupN/NixA family nickel/cobalt transporter [Petrachloros mirabilis]